MVMMCYWNPLQGLKHEYFPIWEPLGNYSKVLWFLGSRFMMQRGLESKIDKMEDSKGYDKQGYEVERWIEIKGEDI